MLWSNVSKQEQDMGMMPPPGTNLVPLASRRSSTSVAAAASAVISNEVHSPPVRVLKQELIDDSSQSSIIDPLELPPQERFRHLSESSLDVHPGDSNMSIINENSMDLLRHNPVNMDLMNDSSVSGGVYEGSMDVNVGNSNLTTITEDSSCSTMMHCTGRPPLMSMEEIKGIDLRMKMPMATVADLVNTTAPSLATLHRFGVTEASTLPLPAQSGQSVENYLTTLETVNKPTDVTVATTNNPTEKLDALVNSAIETHMGGSPQNETASPKATAPEIMITSQDVMLNQQPALMVPPMITTTAPETVPQSNNSPNIPPEVILNTQISPSIMCRNTEDTLLPNTMETNLLPIPQQPSPLLTTTSNHHQSIPNLVASTEAEKAILFKATVDLLQTQKKLSELERKMSPTATENIDFLNPGTLVQNQFNTSPRLPLKADSAPVIPVPVKEIAVVAPPQSTVTSSSTQEKKQHDDRMIPPAFATMSESDLISMINPSCFDQGNNFQ